MPRLGWELAIESWLHRSPGPDLPKRRITIERVGKVLAVCAEEGGQIVAHDTIKHTSSSGLLDAFNVLAQKLTAERAER